MSTLLSTENDYFFTTKPTDNIRFKASTFIPIKSTKLQYSPNLQPFDPSKSSKTSIIVDFHFKSVKAQEVLQFIDFRNFQPNHTPQQDFDISRILMFVQTYNFLHVCCPLFWHFNATIAISTFEFNASIPMSIRVLINAIYDVAAGV